MQTKKVLLFNIENAKKIQIENVCKKCNALCKTIAPADYSKTLGELAGVLTIKKNMPPYTGGELPAEMLVFSGFPDNELDEFLKHYRESGISPVALKAVITTTNVFWSAIDTYRELLKESLYYKRK